MSGFGLLLLLATPIVTVAFVGFRISAWAALAAAALVGVGFAVLFFVSLSFSFGCDGSVLKGLNNCPDGVRELLSFRMVVGMASLGLWGAIISLPICAITLVAACVAPRHRT